MRYPLYDPAEDLAQEETRGERVFRWSVNLVAWVFFAFVLALIILPFVVPFILRWLYIFGVISETAIDVYYFRFLYPLLDYLGV